MAAYIPASQMADLDNEEKTKFMHKVYELHCKASAAKRSFVADLPEKELLLIEDGEKARTDAAMSCKLLLVAAREALEEGKQAKEAKALKVKAIGVSSGYRSARLQFRLWRERFPKYYRLTEDARAGKSGGEHGDAAARHLKSYIAARLAAPGFSLHNSGIAIDFFTRDGGQRLGPSKSQCKPWKKSWFYEWMTNNAADFGFYLNTAIDEPWHWELTGNVQVFDFSDEEDQSSDLYCSMENGDDYPY